jgi:hypothetical protein
MKKNYVNGALAPSAVICINKSRLKIYHKESNPTYYLENGQEFSIELHNPTHNTVLAKIELNGKQISQGGIVLRPAERIFLERYIDVPNKFKFETYKVSNTKENREAIKENGDIVVRFYNESTPYTTYTYNPILTNGTYYNNNLQYYYNNPNFTTASPKFTVTTTNGIATSGSYSALNALNTTNTFNSSGTLNMTTMDAFAGNATSNYTSSIETGRVEGGSDSNQKFQFVNKMFDNYPFFTVEYKLLPFSNKINTVGDINVKRYCHNCGAKLKSEYKYCPHCSVKI